MGCRGRCCTKAAPSERADPAQPGAERYSPDSHRAPDPSTAFLSGPIGIAVGYSDCPARSETQSRSLPCGLWYDVTDLGDGKLALTIGHITGDDSPAGLSTQIMTVLRATGDPVAALATASTWPTDLKALCAVIDRPAGQLCYSSLGDLRPLLAGADTTPVLLDPAIGRRATAELPPAATVLLCSAAAERAAPLLGQCVTQHPDQAVAQIIASLPPPTAPLAVILYRQPPGPLELTVPATPPSLAPVRNHLRRWLALTGVDSETGADALLAVGEAASNATEHAAAGAGHPVDLTVSATAADGRLRFTVSDNGCWKPPPDLPGNRGHGIRLITALVDNVELITTQQGTTVNMVVNMVKEARR